ncbi:MAG: hypothetical protein QM528_04125 [Phycisphaerales bacterium]|nr:hypothetical protein [Phycisphaerales bacterium]
MINKEHEHLSVTRQCELLDLSRSTFYYKHLPESANNQLILNWLDKQYLETIVMVEGNYKY